VPRAHGDAMERSTSPAQARLANHTIVGLALGVAWGLKEFYSRASFDDLHWVLAPTAWLVARFTGTTFEVELHQAYLCKERLFAIVPACAGVNFLIVVFCALACGLVHTRATIAGRLGLVLASALVAYTVTLLANATRIAIAMDLHTAGASLGVVTPDRLHAAVGAAVYFLFLCVTLVVGARVSGAGRALAL